MRKYVFFGSLLFIHFLALGVTGEHSSDRRSASEGPLYAPVLVAARRSRGSLSSIPLLPPALLTQDIGFGSSSSDEPVRVVNSNDPGYSNKPQPE